MSKKKAIEKRYIVGVVVSDVLDHRLGLIREIVQNFVGAAWTHGQDANATFPHGLQVIGVVESDTEAQVAYARFPLAFCRIESMRDLCESFTKQYRGKKKGVGDVSGPENPTVMVGVGSRAFCELWITFWASQPGKPSEWSQKMIRHLIGAENGTTIWLDSADEHVRTSNIIRMAGDFAAFCDKAS